MKIMCTNCLANRTRVAVVKTVTLSVKVTVRGFPRKTVVSVPLHSRKVKGAGTFTNKILSKVMRPVNTILAVLTTNLVIPTLPCLLDFTTKTVLCMMIRRLVPRVSTKRRSGVKALFFTVKFSLVVVLSMTLKWASGGTL